MQLSEQEYKELIKAFEYFNDKVEECYSKETTNYLKELKEDYKKYIK